MPQTIGKEAGGIRPHGATGGSGTSCREVLHALRVQASMPRTWPVLLFVVAAAGLASSLLAWLAVSAATDGQLGNPPPWLVATGTPAAVYVGVLWSRIDTGRRALETRFRAHGRPLDGSRNVAEDRMLREVAEQCRALGIARPPAVHACDPEVFDRGPFAHAGLVDGGRVGIPEPWLHGPTPRALRFVVGHELSHVLHRDGFIHEVVSAFIALFLRLPGTLCAAFVLLLIVVAVPVSAAAVALAAVMAAVVRDAGPLLAVLAAIPEIIVGIPSIPQVKGAATIAVGVACVGGGLVLYRLWVGRRQELKADETALRVAGAEAAHEGIDLIARLEGASGEGPVPLTREHYRGAVVGALVAVAALLLPRGGETHGARLTLAVAAWVGVHVGDVLWRSADALKRLPGAEVVRHGVWRLTRTHPTPAERKRHVERLLAARRYPGAHPSRESVR